MDKKIIKIHTEFIELQQLLKLASVISNGGEAKFYLASNKVYVNDELENRRGRKIYPGFSVKGKDFEILVENEN